MSKNKQNISIALQGGGAHGAFAWGVMDKILEDGRFNIKGISGTSAGGMNAACVIQGLIEGDCETARQKLHDFWYAISKMSADMRFEKMEELDPDYLNNPSKLFSLHQNWFDFISDEMKTHLSPYYFNPTNANPFLDFLKSFFNFECFHNAHEHRIFLGATHVKTGKIKIFSNNEICEQTLMASACLPHVFQTVEYNGEHYWDGGFIANPAIYPLMELNADDIVIVQLTKTHCEDIPTTKKEISDRLKEITYNGCLVREMRAIYFISKLIDSGVIPEGALRRFNIHMVKSEESFKNLKLASAHNPAWGFINALKDEGRRAAQGWIEDFFSKTPEERRQLNTKLFEDFV